MYNWFPDKIPIKELKTDTEADRIHNCNLAFQVGKDAGVENLLDGEDIVLIQDKKSIILYVSEIYGTLHESPVKFTCPPEWDRNYDRKIEDAKIAERKAQLEAAKTGKAHFSFGRQAGLKGGIANKFLNNMLSQSEPSSPAATRKEEEEEGKPPRLSESTSSPSTPFKDRWNPEAQKKEEEEEKLRESKQAEIRKQMEPKKEEAKKEEPKKEEPKEETKNESIIKECETRNENPNDEPKQNDEP